MALDSESTLEEIKAAFADNASYEENASVTEAQAFISACRLLQFKLPVRSSHGGGGGEEIELNHAALQTQIDQARAWITANATTTGANSGAARYASFERFRE